jgi:predicted ATP-grasp superfamily ATP-dependent carboligase
MIRWLLTLVLLLVSLALPNAAQTNDANSSGKSPSNAAGPESASNPAPSAPKKVWTNDNLSEASKKISVIGTKGDQKYPLTRAADPATAEKIRKELIKLQGQVEDIKKQLAIYKEFLDGEAVSTSGYQVDKGYGRIPVEQQMVMLEKKKKDLESQIDEQLDEARKKGIDPGQLR